MQLVASILSCAAVARGFHAAAGPRRLAPAPLPAVETEAEAPPANPRSRGLALELDDGTRKVHSVAENTQFVAGFFRGLAQQKSFAALTAAFYFIYEAMEEAMDATSCEAVRRLDRGSFRALRRLPYLERDMEFYFGPQWRETVRPSAATRAYVAQIKRTAEGPAPELLLGHMYSRYLGDLFGGQMMSGMAVKSLGLQTGNEGGLAFYNFDQVPETRAMITDWYTALNDVGEELLTEDQRKAIVEEANVVFRLNIDVFNELEGNPVAAALSLATGAIRDKVAALFSSKAP